MTNAINSKQGAHDFRFRAINFGKAWVDNGDHVKWSLEDDTFTIVADGSEVSLFMVDIDNLIGALNMMKHEISENCFTFSGHVSEPLKIEIETEE